MRGRFGSLRQCASSASGVSRQPFDTSVCSQRTCRPMMFACGAYDTHAGVGMMMSP